MNRDVDDVLAEAGARWRADQPSPPEPDLDRMLRPRRPKRWVPVLAAASVAAIAVAVIQVLPHRDQAPSVAPGKEHPLLVRDGDKVQVEGQVVAAPSAPVYYCLPIATTLPLDVNQQTKPPACTPGQQIEVTGVDVNRLEDLTTVLGVKSGTARLVGTWNAGRIAVEQQSAPTPPAPGEPDKVPCPPPAGGWQPGDASTAITPALDAFVKARADQLQTPWIGWPEGSPNPKPGQPPNKPSVLVVGVAHGDVEAIRKALDPLVAANLCVTKVRVSQNEIAAQRAAVEKLPLDDLHITGIGVGVGDRPVIISLRILDQRAADVFRPIGLDNLTFQPLVRPAP
ncbi:hypothetical protein FB561_6191 [Kribbella amoyensis]|uniref:Uncharacterized protein n=1 Tax=Kribbella amoyensis TaxID=996641 RepID=A0A561B7F2_9ACTN|nr:hypothetical protein [Kribbella amoyensis]TWD74760.1 hypothetical protein FB561_6191 [Kribbella amoyensis]